MTNKRTKAFLLLGVILLSIVVSGCAPEPGTKPTEMEYGADSVYVIDKSYIDGCDIASITESLLAAAHPRIRGEEMEALFDEFFVGIEVTNDSVRIDEVSGNNGTRFPCQINFNCADGTNPLTILIYDDGTLGLMRGEDEYVSLENSVVDLELLKERIQEIGM